MKAKRKSIDFAFGCGCPYRQYPGGIGIEISVMSIGSSDSQSSLFIALFVSSSCEINNILRPLREFNAFSSSSAASGSSGSLGTNGFSSSVKSNPLIRFDKPCKALEADTLSCQTTLPATKI